MSDIMLFVKPNEQIVKETEKKEEFRLEVTGKIYIQPLVVLKTLITELEIPAEDVSELTKVKAIELITQFLKDKQKDEDKGTTALLHINDLVGNKTPTETAEGIEEISKDEEQEDKCSLWRKDFKIAGQIGDSKACISFTSLIRQIEAGTEKGYDDREIIQVVIRSISAVSSLRNYLEGRGKLTLSTLRGILRAHYREKTATELYTELCNLSQSPKESPQEFLLGTLDIRQIVIFASKETEDGHQYHPDLVQAMFLQFDDRNTE
ncbi:unnamed protein product [Mytilus coruscus]|uniref:Uncharacterized protein n=1 Tax=Mytilus coruscus TaxID=42192 RepID=A0A6J8AXP0_MYTCO|nr:unnamed protein product [Mytilus coruscus]